jgi:spermidine synthase
VLRLSADYTDTLKGLDGWWGKICNQPVVYEERHTRSLQFDPFAVQSSMRKSAPFELDLSYTRAMMAFQLFRGDPKDILIIGLGGGSLPKYCFDKFPLARITTVEIDTRVIELRDQFYIPKDSDRFRIVHADAEQYLMNADAIADVILLDGFDTFGLPENLSSQRFYDNCYAALRDQGVVVANLLSSDPQMSLHLQRIRTSCQGQKFRTIAWLEGNTIAFGIKQGATPDWQEFYARAKSIKALTGLNLTRHVRRMERNHCKLPLTVSSSRVTSILQ